MERDPDKAVILARGLGTRMRKVDHAAGLDRKQAAAAETGVKAMIPIDRPFLDYVLHNLAEAGYRQICLVIGPEHQELRNYYAGVNARRLEFSFAIQEKPRGTADAVLAAEAFAGNDPFLVINSDNFYPVAACRALRQLRQPGLAVFERESMLQGSNIPAERVLKFAVCETDEAGSLRRIIEKPDEAAVRRLGSQVYLSMNCWRFGRSIFAACRAIKPSVRGELELTDAVQYAIDTIGENFRVLTFHSSVLDLSCQNDIGPVTAKLKGMEVCL